MNDMQTRSPEHDHDHDAGLTADLERMNVMRLSRRRALGLLAGSGGVLALVACGDDLASAGSDGTVTVSSTSSTSTTTGGTTTTTSGGTATCTIPATETAGPYPADGTNTSPGVSSNVLPVNGIVRSDIRSSFIGSTAAATGVALTVTITVVDANNSCAPLSGYAVYLWHCDIAGRYSLYDLPNESYLRGVQVTNASGQVTFTTIYPGCYNGRFPHMHFEVFSSLNNASSGRFSVLTSQFAMPDTTNTLVYATTAYAPSLSNYSGESISSDGVFGNNTTAQMAVMTLAMSGSVAAGFAATTTVAVAT